MDANELRALADALLPMAAAPCFDGIDVERAADCLRAQADAHPALAVPAGWAVVPIKPTEAMKAAGGHVNSEWLNDDAPLWEGRYTRPMDGVWSAMLAAAPAVPQAEPKRDWSAIDAAIREYLDGYEQIGENDAGADACYTPTERELYLIYDAINGLLADENFMRLIAPHPAPAPQSAPQEK